MLKMGMTQGERRAIIWNTELRLLDCKHQTQFMFVDSLVKWGLKKWSANMELSFYDIPNYSYLLVLMPFYSPRPLDVGWTLLWLASEMSLPSLTYKKTLFSVFFILSCSLPCLFSGKQTAMWRGSCSKELRRSLADSQQALSPTSSKELSELGSETSLSWAFR